MLNSMGIELVNMPYGWFLRLIVAYLMLFLRILHIITKFVKKQTRFYEK